MRLILSVYGQEIPLRTGVTLSNDGRMPGGVRIGGAPLGLTVCAGVSQSGSLENSLLCSAGTAGVSQRPSEPAEAQTNPPPPVLFMGNLHLLCTPSSTQGLLQNWLYSSDGCVLCCHGNGSASCWPITACGCSACPCVPLPQEPRPPRLSAERPSCHREEHAERMCV